MKSADKLLRELKALDQTIKKNEKAISKVCKKSSPLAEKKWKLQAEYIVASGILKAVEWEIQVDKMNKFFFDGYLRDHDGLKEHIDLRKIVGKGWGGGSLDLTGGIRIHLSDSDISLTSDSPTELVQFMKDHQLKIDPSNLDQLSQKAEDKVIALAKIRGMIL